MFIPSAGRPERRKAAVSLIKGGVAAVPVGAAAPLGWGEVFTALVLGWGAGVVCA